MCYYCSFSVFLLAHLKHFFWTLHVSKILFCRLILKTLAKDFLRLPRFVLQSACIRYTTYVYVTLVLGLRNETQPANQCEIDS